MSKLQTVEEEGGRRKWKGKMNILAENYAWLNYSYLIADEIASHG